jgi:predicted Zn finger-like uncharacterized protein
MLIICPNCGTSYRITPESLGEAGRSVRCVGCHQVWHEAARPVLAEAVPATGPEPIDASLIRPPLNDVVEIGSAQADVGGDGAVTIQQGGSPAKAVDDLPGYEAAPSIVPPAESGRVTMEAAQNIERTAAARAGKGARTRRSLSRHALPAAIFGLALILVCLLAARQQVVRFLPQTASLYAAIGLPVNLRGLAFANIKSAREMQDDVPMLVIEGEIVGTTGRHTEVPRLRFAVTDGSGKEIYAWTGRPSRTLLPPGEALPFRSRLASPPAEASGISVRFFNRRDAQAGFM